MKERAMNKETNWYFNAQSCLRGGQSNSVEFRVLTLHSADTGWILSIPYCLLSPPEVIPGCRATINLQTSPHVTPKQKQNHKKHVEWVNEWWYKRYKTAFAADRVICHSIVFGELRLDLELSKQGIICAVLMKCNVLGKIYSISLCLEYKWTN